MGDFSEEVINLPGDEKEIAGKEEDGRKKMNGWMAQVKSGAVEKKRMRDFQLVQFFSRC